MLDQYDLKVLNIAWLRSQMGLVSQEPILFDRTIGDNIKYGDNTRDVSMEEVIECAKKANIHDFISQLPKVCLLSFLFFSFFFSEKVYLGPRYTGTSQCW